METVGLLNNTIRLNSGRYFDLLNPDRDSFHRGDIAGALSKICRFGGHIERFYSVAEHSVICSNCAKDDGLSEELQLALLLHDAAEAFVGDCVRPLKVLLPKYIEIEKRIEAVIGDRYGVDFARHKDAIRKIDNEVLFAERRALFSRDDGVKWTGEDDVRRIDPLILGLTPKEAEAYFLRKLSLLFNP